LKFPRNIINRKEKKCAQRCLTPLSRAKHTKSFQLNSFYRFAIGQLKGNISKSKAVIVDTFRSINKYFIQIGI
jgi:hypothetical protein